MHWITILVECVSWLSILTVQVAVVEPQRITPNYTIFVKSINCVIV